MVLKGFEIHLGKEPMRVGHHLDCCSLNSLTLVPPEDGLSDAPKGMGQPGRERSLGTGWDAASEGYAHRAAAARLQGQRKQCEEAAWVT